MARAGGRQRSSAKADADEDSDFFVRALARGLTILALFDIEHPEWGLNEICERTGMSKTTAYRMLRTLEAKDFLVYDASTERYHLGGATIPGAYLAMSYVGFVRAAHPFLEQLAEATRRDRGAHGGQRRGRGRGRRGGHHPSVPAESSHRSHPEQHGQLVLPPAHGLQTRRRADEDPAVGSSTDSTPNTVTDPDEIIRRMAAERADGLAWDLEEQDMECVPSRRRCSSATAA